MKLYEINREIEDLIENSVDHETGEIAPDVNERLDALIQDKNQKIINAAKYIKNRSAFVEAMRDEVKKLQARIKSEETKCFWLEGYARAFMDHGVKYEDSQCCVSLRRASRVEVLDLEKIPTDFKKEKVEILADKKLIADAIKGGKQVEGACLVDAYSLQIK